MVLWGIFTRGRCSSKPVESESTVGGKDSEMLHQGKEARNLYASKMYKT